MLLAKVYIRTPLAEVNIDLYQGKYTPAQYLADLQALLVQWLLAPVRNFNKVASSSLQSHPPACTHAKC